MAHLLIVSVVFFSARINPYNDNFCILDIVEFPVTIFISFAEGFIPIPIGPYIVCGLGTIFYGIFGAILNLGWWFFCMFGYGSCDPSKYAGVQLLVSDLFCLSFYGPFVGALISIIGSRRIYLTKKYGKGVAMLGIIILAVNPIWLFIVGGLIESRTIPCEFFLALLKDSTILIAPIILIVLPGILVIRRIKHSLR